MPRPSFEVGFDDLKADLEKHVETVFASLESDFITMPKGPGFIAYPVFEAAYDELKHLTEGFANFNDESVSRAVTRNPMIFIVLRTMLAFTPPEWAYPASRRSKIEISQNQARALDRGIRLAPASPLKLSPTSLSRLSALVKTACHWLRQGAPRSAPDRPHRLDKADTKHGLPDLQNPAVLGVPYAMLLYERFLGRPFAGHRDSVSELIGDGLESVIEAALDQARMSFRKTKRAARLPGFDQAPDFVLPDEFSPRIVIEAKITEDDGTAGDKVTRIQHLAELGRRAADENGMGFAVIARIGGRGFGVRREDMRKPLLATRGKVFTLKTLPRLAETVKLLRAQS